jgi:hypothetical protein
VGLANPRHFRKLDLREACGSARSYQLFGEDQPLRGNGLLFGRVTWFLWPPRQESLFRYKVGPCSRVATGWRCVTSPHYASRLLIWLGHTENCQDIRRIPLRPEGIIHAFRADEAFVLARGAKPLPCGCAIYRRCRDMAPRTLPLAPGCWPPAWAALAGCTRVGACPRSRRDMPMALALPDRAPPARQLTML